MTANREDDEARSLLARVDALEADLAHARARGRFLDALLEAVPGFVLHVGDDLRVRSLNREQPGIAHAQVIGAHVDDLMRADGGAADVRDAIATGAPVHYGARVVGPLARPMRLECWAAPIAEPDGAGKRSAVIVAVDVTESREREERLREAQRLEAVGQLASGVAHNFNNMLAAILPALELVRPLLPPSRQLIVDEAAEAGFRAAEMVRQLMAFAGHRRGAPRRTESLARIAGRAIGICRQLFPHHVLLEVVDRAESACVHADPGEIEQVILNLLINARDAVVDRGHRSPTIRVTIDVAAGRDAPGAVPAARADERFARVRVEDDGIGMTEEVRRRIFEPFFTTKEVGRGTGLGLATAWAAVEEHDGFLACSSIPGQGTTFDLLLPIARDDDASSERRSGVGPIGRGEQILIVEDEPGVRDATAMLLEDAGFHTTRVASAAEAIAFLHAGIHLVLLDRSMPGGIGDTVVDEVRARAPRAAVILFTGQEPPIDEAQRVDDVLLKPASGREILQVVRAALDLARRR